MEKAIYIALAILFGSMVTFALLDIIGAFPKWTWLCKKMKWHLSPKSLNSVCPRCGKRVLQDSNGNWF